MDEWRSLVELEQEVARRRAEVNRLPSRPEILTGALLNGSVWDRSVALEFLRDFPEDVPRLLEILVDLSLSPGWLKQAGEAIRAARQDISPSRFVEVARRATGREDVEDYRSVCCVLADVGAWQALGVVVEQASGSRDPAIREIAQDFSENYGKMIS
ncbi:hypothetical protein [Nocardiopsis ganjiahuensis]|uniref:hypothetical protein n=1 Tax=Nocardiopsis ganjiahuensis TaxID=239984 RepID=UPI000347F344|nr:hypothetical protein [Nocardiopsis ganjiahuensis]